MRQVFLPLHLAYSAQITNYFVVSIKWFNMFDHFAFSINLLNNPGTWLLGGLHPSLDTSKEYVQCVKVEEKEEKSNLIPRKIIIVFINQTNT